MQHFPTTLARESPHLRHRTRELHGLFAQRFGGRRRFLHQGRVLLCHVVQLAH